MFDCSQPPAGSNGASMSRWRFYFEKRTGCDGNGGRLDACGSRDRTGGRATSRLDLRTFRSLRAARKKKGGAQTPLGCFVGLLTHVQRGEGGVGAPLSSPLSFGVVSCCCLEKFGPTE